MTTDEQKTGTPIDELRAARAKVLSACAAELRELLDRHGCALVAIPEYVSDGAGGFKPAARIEITVKL